jgi:acetate kinase
MVDAPHAILTLNAGSSSVKFALFTDRICTVRGEIQRIGQSGSTLTVGDAAPQKIDTGDHGAAASAIIDWLRRSDHLWRLDAIGHRIVQGGPKFSAPQIITADLIAALRDMSPFDPEHLPSELHLVEVFAGACPSVPQIACFDTYFHRDLPPVARLLPIPRRYAAQGLRRYGFHGLSYAFLLEELGRRVGPAATAGRLVLAHLGNGASLCAVQGGRSIETSMGFTPTGGVPMSTRSGDLDPGIFRYLAATDGLNAEQFFKLATHESGLLGLSETSSDVRDLLERSGDDPRAREAIALFCYQIRKQIGALAAALGGIDHLVFAGGIGENAAVIRAQICEGLGFLGITLDPARNEQHDAVISIKDGAVPVHIIKTDEASIIAKLVSESLASRGMEHASP